MNKILVKKPIAEKVCWFEVEAPRIARKHKPGQFVIVRLYEGGERIPLTIADSNPEKGTIVLVVQEVGKTTAYMCNELKEGDYILDIVGPLGSPTHIEKVGTVLGIGGGVGIAPLYPIMKGFKQAGNEVIVILGARRADLLIMEDMMKEIADELLICTDDGSKGRKALVTELEKELLESGRKIDQIVAIGPAIMMKYCVETARPFNVPIIVSLNTIMIDGTGMCGGCRIRYGNEEKFVCVDGPEFDGYLVDFDNMIKRQRTYVEYEKKAYEDYKCRLGKKIAELKQEMKQEGA